MATKQKKSHLPHISLFFLLSFTIVFIWFRNRLLFATAEEGLIFYSLSKTWDLYRDVWVRWGMGFVYSEGLLLGISAKIFSYLELFLSNVGSQMLVFVLLIFSGTYGTFVFTFKISKIFIAKAAARITDMMIIFEAAILLLVPTK